MTDQVTPAPASSPIPVPAPATAAAAAAATFNPQTINYRGLTEQVTPAQIAAFRAQTKAAQRANPGIDTGLRTATSVTSVVALSLLGVVFLPIVLVIFFLAIGSAAGGGGIGALFGFLAVPIFIAGLVVVIVIAVRHFGRGQWNKWLRLTQFAADNGLRFRTRNANPSYQGMIFHIGDTRLAYDHLNSVSGRYFDVGNFQFSTGSGKSRSTSHWGFVALQLDRRLPNMVLDAKSNNGFFGVSDLPITFKKDQVLSLEGNFNDYFTLYCPKEYETDALYVFTPDLMALLIDNANSFDVEIVDDWMFVYSRQPFDMLLPLTFERVFSIVATVGSKTVTQTENYHDDRVGSPSANIVAPQGQRLRHGVSLFAIIIVVVVVGGWLIGTLGPIVGLLR